MVVGDGEWMRRMEVHLVSRLEMWDVAPIDPVTEWGVMRNQKTLNPMRLD